MGKNDGGTTRETQRCMALGDVELLENIRNDPRFPLWPAVRVLLDRVEVKPENEEVLTAYENPPKSSVEDMQKIVDANEKLIKELKDAKD